MKRLMLAALLTYAVNAATLGAEPCTDFRWDVSKEHSLFAGPALAVAAAKSAAAAESATAAKPTVATALPAPATITTDRLYGLTLAPRKEISFAAPPGKSKPVEGETYAGLLFFQVATAGNYRVAIDSPFWIDVVDAGAGSLVAATDFQGRRNCDAPHKIVVFELQAGRSYVLQLSDAEKRTVRLTLTQSPAP